MTISRMLLWKATFLTCTSTCEVSIVTKSDCKERKPSRESFAKRE